MARTAKNFRDSSGPTGAERAIDEATHSPSRSWCVERVDGRRDNPPHRRFLHDENAGSEILMDCGFAGRDNRIENVAILLLVGDSRAIQTWVVVREALMPLISLNEP